MRRVVDIKRIKPERAFCRLRLFKLFLRNNVLRVTAFAVFKPFRTAAYRYFTLVIRQKISTFETEESAFTVWKKFLDFLYLLRLALKDNPKPLPSIC